MSVPAPMVDSLNSGEERVVRRTVLAMAAQSVAVSMGLLCGLGLFVATNFLVLRGGENVGPHLGLLAAYFPGYRVTFLGSVIGFAYASLIGYFTGLAIATIYNRMVSR